MIIRNSEILEGKPYLAGTRMGVHTTLATGGRTAAT